MNLDWLEDSLLEERAVEEKDYLWQRKVKLAAEAKASKKARAADAREREEKAGKASNFLRLYFPLKKKIKIK